MNNLEIYFNTQNSTLYINKISPEYYNQPKFQATFENICNLKHLDKFLEKAYNAKKEDIFEFEDSKGGGERFDKGVFKVKVELDIEVDGFYNFVWANVIFMRDVKMYFNATNTQETSIDLEKCTFKQYAEFKVSNSSEYEVEVNFKDNVFEEKFKLLWSEANKTNFDRTQFLGECKFSDYGIENKLQNISFKNCIFGEKDSDKSAEFKKCEFKQNVNFSNCKFHTDAYFNNATFKESADFHECEFEKVACFYDVTFEKTPNFSQVIFKGSLNLVNAKLDFDFKGLGETIQKECETTADTKSLAECANDFRDSFRLFKNALIKDNNLLDASNHHRIELYCKEIELDSKISNAQASVKELIDSCVLKFYRHTSDHHTDLLKIWHTLLILIGIFGILSGGVVIGFDYCCLKAWDWNAHTLIELYNTYIKHFVLAHTICALIINLLLFVLFVGLFLAMILNQVNEMIGKIFTILRLVSIALCCFVIIFAFAYLLRLCIPECMLIYCMIFIFIVVLLVMAIFAYCKGIIKGARNLFIGVSYFITIFILISSPKYLIPAIGIFTDKRVMFDPLSIAGGVYTILFGFILYSFIKTARKNSIVPH
uniref:Membrane protein n=1 Tax=uncultured Helicobacter sp. TaxID=175537 RepID=A0A650EM11_9HELI|nr:membrane protein [uncultured Helicobacter sp.]